MVNLSKTHFDVDFNMWKVFLRSSVNEPKCKDKPHIGLEAPLPKTITWLTKKTNQRAK